MAQNEPGELVKLEDTGKTVADEREDIRGYAVKAASGEDIGTVEDLLIDLDEEKVRFLIVASGGFLGIGKDKSFIPIDAIKSINEENKDVLLDRSRDQVAGAPGYDPELADVKSFYEGVYGYYGLSPYWSTGYAHPGYPYYFPR
ncbi:PRC-barrel domain-containing protein [Pseudarthrobacter oxydans]|uniref:PRC-barrel domain-containing protein n=1 Tax=Pseudarthrobacter oxydans TaxID=1671 RepID=UPI00380284CA